jgi:hypothetical protein
MSLLARSVARSVPRRGARFYSEEIAPIVVEPTPQWRAQQEALAHHAHGRNIYLFMLYIYSLLAIKDASELWRRIRYVSTQINL